MHGERNFFNFELTNTQNFQQIIINEILLISDDPNDVIYIVTAVVIAMVMVGVVIIAVAFTIR